MTFLFVIYLITTSGIDDLKVYLESKGATASIIIFLLRFLSVIIPALPSTAYSLLAGALLGFKKGLLVNLLLTIFSVTFLSIFVPLQKVDWASRKIQYQKPRE